jgi:cell division protein FtsA
MQRALEGARAVALPENQEVIHTIARSWTVDGETEVQQPVGMSAYRLEVDAHIVTGSSTAINNLVQCVAAHGIDIDELVLEPLAANEAVLRAEERRMGVAVVDMGGGTSDLAVFIENGLCHTVILDMGGNHLTNDVAVALRCPFETAEEIKLRYGTLLPERVAPDETVWANVFGEKSERSFSRRFICDVLEARALEMLEIVADKLTASGFIDRLPAGIVLTGGCSQLPGFAELGRSTLGMPVRVGAAQNSLPDCRADAPSTDPRLCNVGRPAALGIARGCTRGASSFRGRSHGGRQPEMDGRRRKMAQAPVAGQGLR